MVTQQSNLKEKILNSEPNQWTVYDTPRTWVFWPESISIETIGRDGYGSQPPISQPDFATFLDTNHDRESQIRITHNGVPFDQLSVLCLNRGRISMVEPHTDPSTGDEFISQYEAKISEIMSTDDFSSEQGDQIDVEIRGIGV